MKFRHWFLTMMLSVPALQAQSPMKWPEGRTAAIVLTYDDAMTSQLDVAVPQLAEAGFKATFFLDQVGDLDARRWKDAQRAGHELGNHSVFHPCPRALLPDRKQHHTEDYDVRRMLAEVAEMNLTLSRIDSQKTRTYAAPCSQTLVGGQDYVDELRRVGLVAYLRTGGGPYDAVIADFTTLDAFAVPSWGPVDSPDGKQLIAFAERVMAANGLGVYQFHGVGGEYLPVTSGAHHELLAFLRAHPEIWVGTFREVMDYVVTGNR